MNLYALLPLIASLSNIYLGWYILFKDPTNRLNRVFSLFAFSLAFWALCDFLIFISPTPNEGLFWNRISIIGVSLTVSFLFHYFLIFTKNKFMLQKTYHLLLYLPAIFFVIVGFTTDWISVSAETVYWGQKIITGILYPVFAFYTIGYTIFGLLLCYRYLLKTKNSNEKTQTKFLILAISVPVIGGIITETIPNIFNFNIIPLTTTLTTITAIIVAYTIIKYQLMSPISVSIQKKILAGFLIIVLFVVSVDYYTVDVSQNTLKEYIGNNSVMLAYDTLDAIDENIYNRIEELRSYSRSTYLQNTIINSNKEFENMGNISAYISEKDNEWKNTSKEVITPFMELLINNTLSDDLRGQIDSYRKGYGYLIFGEIFVTNKYGANVAQTGKTSDYYQADESWWKIAKDENFSVTDVEYDNSSGVYSIDIGIKIKKESGEFIGVIKAVLDIEESLKIINELVDSRYQEEHAYIYHETMHFKLLDNKGQIIYTTSEFEQNDFKIFSPISEYLYNRCIIGGKGSDYFIGAGDESNNDEELFAYATSTGHNYFKGFGWKLLIEYDMDEIFAPVIELRNNIILFLVLVTILTVIISIYISRSISKPIINLRNIVKKIGDGNLHTQITTTSNDEIGDLTVSFKKMTNNLMKQQENLEKIVEERTIDLEKKIDELERFKKVTVGRELRMVELKKEIDSLKKNMIK